LAFVDLLQSHQKFPHIGSLVRYIERFLAYQVYSLVSEAKQENPISEKEISLFLNTHIAWPQPPPIVKQ
jgi:hypothetical protein